MPAISLRLTNAELAELKVWAHDAKRSVQKEIVWRLFAAEAHMAPKIGPATNETRQEISVPPDGTEVVLEQPKPKKRLHPCRHHVPPSKVCQYCDV